MTTLSEHPIPLYRPTNPLPRGITHLIKPSPTSPTLPATSNLTTSNLLHPQYVATAITTALSPDKILHDKHLKESWNKGRKYGLQEGALMEARRKAVALAGMKVFLGVVVDIAPVEQVQTEREIEEEVETEKESATEEVIFTPDTSNKDTDDEGVEEGDLLDFEGRSDVEQNLASTIEDVDTDISEQLAVTVEPSDRLMVTISTEVNTPVDTLHERFGIPSQSRIQPVNPNFWNTRTIPPYPLEGDVEAPDVLLIGPLGESTLEEWKHDHGRGYIMDKVKGVFSTVLYPKTPDETYVKVEFHSRRTRDDALRVFGGVVDSREGPLFVKGGYPWYVQQRNNTRRSLIRY
ncbi:hypothetical protein QBC41DRAFT_288095 [Cercophora samala]|uniref:Uncharacterized protein n=1 Tax=Cercophora samala TaxID=330535 RepID=A0AA39YKH9_9PEZI|nr:hypothetical protein QBC41DRAFT_288095 [Cercophora samala]